MVSVFRIILEVQVQDMNQTQKHPERILRCISVFHNYSLLQVYHVILRLKGVAYYSNVQAAVPMRTWSMGTVACNQRTESINFQSMQAVNLMFVQGCLHVFTYMY